MNNALRCVATYIRIVIKLATDFNSTMQTITIIAGTNSRTVKIPVFNDNIVEEDETFIMSLSVPSSLGSKITTGTITSVTVPTYH